VEGEGLIDLLSSLARLLDSESMNIHFKCKSTLKTSLLTVHARPQMPKCLFSTITETVIAIEWPVLIATLTSNTQSGGGQQEGPLPLMSTSKEIFFYLRVFEVGFNGQHCGEECK
jgi:hypothetical protein